jgi:hypothetical protein
VVARGIRRCHRYVFLELDAVAAAVHDHEIVGEGDARHPRLGFQPRFELPICRVEPRDIGGSGCVAWRTGLRVPIELELEREILRRREAVVRAAHRGFLAPQVKRDRR